jgi:ethanolamine ammonia-lyase large subunit
VECETRAYGVARAFEPLLTNTVVGFIGPAHRYDGKQIIRAALEDHFCGKLLGFIKESSPWQMSDVDPASVAGFPS